MPTSPTHPDLTVTVNMSDIQDKDIDELDDDFGSEDENADPNVFRIANALTPPSAMSYSAQELHCKQARVLIFAYSS